MITIAPSILAAGGQPPEEYICVLREQGIRYLHIDVMDGGYVPNFGLNLMDIKKLRQSTDMVFDVHLMVRDPLSWGLAAIRAGADVVTFHPETVPEPVKVLKTFHECGVRTGIVFRPDILADSVPETWICCSDVVQQMTVQPGLPGQTFIRDTLWNIRKLRRILDQCHPEADLEADGDITAHNLLDVLDAGVNVIVSGKGIFKGSLCQNVREFIKITGLYEERTHVICNRY